MPTQAQRIWSGKSALSFVLLFGAVNLFADMTYGLGAHESVMQAAVAEMVSQERLGSAYRLFGTAFGVAWFAGSAALGALYDVSIKATVALAVVAQLLAVVPIAIAARRIRTH